MERATRVLLLVALQPELGRLAGTRVRSCASWDLITHERLAEICEALDPGDMPDRKRECRIQCGGLANTYRGIGPYRGIDVQATQNSSEMQPVRPQITHTGLRRAFSSQRWCGYENTPNPSDEDILACYLYNLELASALQPALHVLEVTLRNAIYDHSTTIVRTSGLKFDRIECWLDTVPSLLTVKHAADVDRAKADLVRQKRVLTPGRLVASLGFGFWTGLFDSQYEHGRSSGPRIWPELAKRAFPNLEKETRNRAHLARHFYELRVLRNRIAHHEPIWKLDVLATYDQICETIGWMNASAMYLVRYTCRESLDVLCAAGPELFATDAELLIGHSTEAAS